MSFILVLPYLSAAPIHTKILNHSLSHSIGLTNTILLLTFHSVFSSSEELKVSILHFLALSISVHINSDGKSVPSLCARDYHTYKAFISVSDFLER